VFSWPSAWRARLRAWQKKPDITLISGPTTHTGASGMMPFKGGAQERQTCSGRKLGMGLLGIAGEGLAGSGLLQNLRHGLGTR
jgi:hypothetical protein